MKIATLSILFFLLTIGSASAFFDTPRTAGSSSADRIIQRVFNEAERAVIEEFYNSERLKKTKSEGASKKGKGDKKGLPPGLAKKEKLPPGLQKQLIKNGRLPPGLEKRSLPEGLYSRIESCRIKGLKCHEVGADVILIDAATEIIVDILRDVI